jgi:TolA-binding protein
MRARLFIPLLALVALLGAQGSTDPAAQFDFANGLFQRGFFKEAAQEYRDFVEKHPKAEQAPLALYRLGEAEYAARNYAEALMALDRFIATRRAGQLEPRAQLRRGEILQRLDRPEEALAVLAPLRKKDVPGEVRAPALYYIGKASGDAGKPAEARQAFEELAADYPDHALTPYGRYHLAYALLALNETEKAAVEFSNVASSSADPDLRAEARFRAAESFDAIQWTDAALKAYQQLREEFPDSDYARKAAYGYTWALYRAGRHDEAAKSAGEYIRQNPESDRVPGLLYLQANCLQQQKQYDAAVAAYRQLREKHPQSEFAPKAQYKVAWVLYLAGRLPEAKVEAARFLEENNDPALGGDAAFLLASIEYGENDFARAVDHFLQVVREHGDSQFAAEALFKAGECQSRLGQATEAARTFSDFAARYPDNPLARDALLKAADAQFLASAYEGAAEKYRKALEANPAPEQEEEILYRLALACHNVQDYAASAEAFKTLVEKHPDSPHVAEAQFRIGDYYLSEGKDPVKAMGAYEAAHKADPKGEFAGRALKGVALARYAAKDLDGAAEMLGRVVQEHPDVPLGEKTYAWMGQYLFDKEQWAPAVAAFEALLRFNPNYAQAEAVRLKIAQARRSAGNSDEALKIFKELADGAKDGAVAAEAKYQLARAYEERKDFDAAQKLYEQLAESNAGDLAAQAQFHLGEVAEAKGDAEGAALQFMRVAILFLHEELTPEALWRAGQCFEKAGRAEDARKAYEELQSDYPDSDQATRAKERLNRAGA